MKKRACLRAADNSARRCACQPAFKSQRAARSARVSKARVSNETPGPVPPRSIESEIARRGIFLREIGVVKNFESCEVLDKHYENAWISVCEFCGERKIK